MEDVRGAIGEVVSIASHEGVAIDPDAIANVLAKVGGFPPETKTSLQRDVESGAEDEGDLLGGAIIRLGTRLGVPTPVTERVYVRVRSNAVVE